MSNNRLRSARLMRKRATSLQVIANEVGVSAMTVSRALNGRPDVNPETRRRIEEVAAALNYTPNRWARSLITNRSQVIGVVVPDISADFYAGVTKGIQEAIELKDYNMMLCTTDRDADREVRDIRMLVSSRVDGLILAPEQTGDSPEPLESLIRQQTPLVLINSRYPQLTVPWVGTDDFAVGSLVAEHFIALGHRDIGHLRGKRVSAGDLRHDGFVATLRAQGIPVRQEWVLDGDFTLQRGRESMTRLASMSPRPTAVFCANDSMAMGAIGACLDLGLRVPEDISIVGAGNIESRHHPFPFLTTVDWPRRRLGRLAAEMLLRLVDGEGREAEQDVTLPPELVVRKSAKALA